jgi:hypothetical protein
MRSRNLSPRVAYILESLRSGLSDWSEPKALHDARRKVIEFQFRRQSGDAALAGVAAELYDSLVAWSDERANDDPKADIDPLEQFLNLLALVRFLTRHGR